MEKHNLAEALSKFRVGNTPLVEINGQEFGLESILVKDESKNNFGTFKDRKSKYIAKKFYGTKIEYVTAITSGNYGYSLSNFLDLAGIKTLLFVPYGINASIAKRLREKATVMPIDLEKEELTKERIKSIAKTALGVSGDKIKDVTNEHDYAYLHIFEEIKVELDKRDKNLDYIIVPLGSGELFSAALRYYSLSDTKVIGVTTDFKDTIASMLYTKYRPMMKNISKNANPSKYGIIKVSEHEIKQAYDKIKTNINCEPSAAAAFVALSRNNFNPSDNVVVVNTGNGSKNFG